jgi:phosphatidylglycerophosphatase A
MPAKDLLVKALASALGLGHLPLAPGTWASAGAAAAYVLLRHLAPDASAVVVGIMLVSAVAVGLLVCPHAMRVYGSSDPRQFVLDEAAGMWLVTLGFPWRSALATAGLSLVAFRLFDVLKPFPIRRVEKLGGPVGVMADDLLAALYAVAALWLLRWAVLDRWLSI